jgi:Ser/Thr protein kinase RdoA (MazF antagonist)
MAVTWLPWCTREVATGTDGGGRDAHGVDPLRPIEIVGHVVRRPAQPSTPTVHAFLRHLRTTGFDCVPAPLGLHAGRETLSYLPGASGREGWFAQHSLDGLRSAARLLRNLRDASVGWSPPDDALWGAPPVPGPGLVMCHGDPGPWNFVWDGDQAVGLIDWDFLHPGPRLDDVAYALRWFAPARSDALALDWHHFPEVPDRRARIEAFLQAYGDLPSFDHAEAIARRMEATIEIERSLAEAGVEPQRTWVEEGHLDEEAEEVRWVREHRSLLE